MAYKVRYVYPDRSYRSIKDEIDRTFMDVVGRGDLVDRRDLAEFQDRLAEFVGVKHCVGVNSGYDALHLSLRAAGIGPGDEVIVPAHTFVATASAVVNVGARPVLVDVGPDFNINPALIEAAVTGKTKGIIPVHLNGYMADMETVMAVADHCDLAVVEDACQSLGASLGGRRAGAWGLTGCWSFYPFKILGGFGDGGAVTTDDPEVARFVTRMRFNGEDRTTGKYHGHGFSCILDNLQAALLSVKLRHLPDWIERRRRVAGRYRDGLSGLPGLTLPHYHDPRRDHVYQNYVVRSVRGDAFSEYLEENGVEVLTQFRKPYYRHEALGFVDRGFPETEALSAEVCSLPMNAEMTDDETDYVIETVRRFFGR